MDLGDSSQCNNDRVGMFTTNGTPMGTTNSSAIRPISSGTQNLASIGYKSISL